MPLSRLRPGVWLASLQSVLDCSAAPVWEDSTILAHFRTKSPPERMRTLFAMKTSETGETFGTLESVHYIVGVRSWGVSVKRGSTVCLFKAMQSNFSFPHPTYMCTFACWCFLYWYMHELLLLFITLFAVRSLCVQFPPLWHFDVHAWIVSYLFT